MISCLWQHALRLCRICCLDCHAEHLLTFSCPMKEFCASCHSKCRKEWPKWMLEELLLDLPHQAVFTIPKIPRIFFQIQPPAPGGTLPLDRPGTSQIPLGQKRRRTNAWCCRRHPVVWREYHFPSPCPPPSEGGRRRF